MRPRVCGVVAVCLGVGLACAHVCAGLLWGLRACWGFVCACGWSWPLGDVRQTHIMERFTRCGSNALDSEALH